jgi:serine/threonine-protein kinase
MPDRRGALDERLAPAAPGIAIALRRLAMARDDARLLDLACDWAMHAGAAHTSTTSKEAVDGVAPALACALVAHARCDDHWLGVAVRELLDGVALGGVSHPRTDSLHHLALLVECAEYEPRAWRDAVVERGRAEAACIAGSVGSDALAASRLHALLRWSEATSDAPAEATLEACRHAVGLDGRRGRLAATDARITTWHLRLCILAQQLAGDADFLEHAEHLAHALLRARGDVPTLDGGLAARGWAMLALHRATGDLAWVRRAERLAARAVRAAAGLDPALGFARGPWEAALLDAELARPEWARLPLVESEGWPRSPAPST